jgi:hypothetical protein
MSDHRPRHVRVSGTPTTIFGCLGKTRPSGFKNWTIWFLRFKAPGQTLPLHDFSHFSLSLTHSRTTVRATPRPPLVIPWFLHEILEFLGEINSKESVSLFPQLIFPILRYFHLILDLFALWMNLIFLRCIVFIHDIDQSPAISLSFLS